MRGVHCGREVMIASGWMLRIDSRVMLAWMDLTEAEDSPALFQHPLKRGSVQACPAGSFDLA